MDYREAHARALEFFGLRVEGIRDDQWQLPTPCSEWDVRALVNHLAYENLWAGELFAGRTIAEVGDVYEDRDLLGEDPKQAYRESASAASSAVAQPGSMDATVHLSFGDFPGHFYASQLTTDLLVHGWDLAVATGQDDRMPGPLADLVLEAVLRDREAIRASDSFADEVEVDEQADVQTRILALLGRDPSKW